MIKFTKNHKPLPPFAKQLLSKPANRLEAHQDLFLFVGADCWSTAKSYRHFDCLAFPFDENPDDFNWREVVKNREILIWLTNNVAHEKLRHLSYVLLRDGALVVRVMSMVYWQMVAIYRKGKGGDDYGY